MGRRSSWWVFLFCTTTTTTMTRGLQGLRLLPTMRSLARSASTSTTTTAMMARRRPRSAMMHHHHHHHAAALGRSVERLSRRPDFPRPAASVALSAASDGSRAGGAQAELGTAVQGLTGTVDCWPHCSGHWVQRRHRRGHRMCSRCCWLCWRRLVKAAAAAAAVAAAAVAATGR